MKRKKNKSPKYIKAGGLNCVVAKLLGGPYDGCETLSSHGSAIFEGEHYSHVEHNGDAPDVFRHSKTYLAANTPGGAEQIAAERKKVEEWMRATRESMMQGGIPVPMATLIPTPPNRIGVHWGMIRAGAE
jgi:hypothetical protein